MSTETFVERIFWTPVVMATMPDHAAINAALEPLILQRYGERGYGEPGAEGSHGGGWQSGTDLLDWGGEAALAIRDRAIALAEEHTQDLHAGRDGHVRGWATMGWANICGYGGFNRPHTHADAYWAAVYYVRVDPGEGGELELHDPRRPAIDMHAPHLRLQPNGGEGAINLRPEPGMLLLFPAWLEHGIAPYYGEGHRISVAMHLSARFGVAVEHDPSVIRV